MFLAEREGFEPSIPFWGIPDFESGAFDHSATFPCSRCCADHSFTSSDAHLGLRNRYASRGNLYPGFPFALTPFANPFQTRASRTPLHRRTSATGPPGGTSLLGSLFLKEKQASLRMLTWGWAGGQQEEDHPGHRKVILEKRHIDQPVHQQSHERRHSSPSRITSPFP